MPKPRFIKARLGIVEIEINEAVLGVKQDFTSGLQFSITRVIADLDERFRMQLVGRSVGEIFSMSAVLKETIGIPSDHFPDGIVDVQIGDTVYVTGIPAEVIKVCPNNAGVDLKLQEEAVGKNLQAKVRIVSAGGKGKGHTLDVTDIAEAFAVTFTNV